MSQLELLNKETPTLAALAALVMPNVNHDTRMAHVSSELLYWQERTNLNPKLLQCTAESVILAIKWAIKNGVSLSIDDNLVYLTTRMVNNVMTVERKLTANGMLAQAYQVGAITGHKRTQLAIDDKTGKVIGATVELCGRNGVWDTITFREGDFARWRGASEKQNRGAANPLYTTGQGGGMDWQFCRTKCLKHALKNLGINPNAPVIREVPATFKAEIAENLDIFNEETQC